MNDIDIEIKLLLEAIYLKYSFDFRDYAMASVKRRVLHSMSQYSCRTVSALQERVIHEPDFFYSLLQYLTVPTSEMFRDPTYFIALREQVFPVLRTYPSLKVWIAGCSTGEELYSMAILLREEGLLDRTLIYATDINPNSLRRAEEGIFSSEAVKKYTHSYHAAGGRGEFSDYYTAAYGSVVFDRKLRQNVVFADHSLATDNVFSEVHLVSCRNVLIYFNRELQERAVGLFYDSLCYKGFLGLGSKETLKFLKQDPMFSVVSRDDRLYQKKVG